MFADCSVSVETPVSRAPLDLATRRVEEMQQRWSIQSCAGSTVEEGKNAVFAWLADYLRGEDVRPPPAPD